MADSAGRGGLGWFAAGLIIGVAGTLATQHFIRSAEPEARPAAFSAAHASSAASDADSDARGLKIVHHGDGSGAPHKPKRPHVSEQTSEQIDDDAAATGMTSKPESSGAPN